MSAFSRTFGILNPGLTLTIAMTVLLIYIYWGSSETDKFDLIEQDVKKDNSKWEISNRGYWVGKGAKFGHNFDKPLSQAMLSYLKSQGASTILKFGGGTGAYARYFTEAGFLISCYDGNPDTQENTEGTCAVMDLSKPLQMSKYQWLISLEVGEHIPVDHEQVFLDNIGKHILDGIILSWAVLGQGGTGHVNNRNNDYIREQMRERGFSSDLDAEKVLRDSATLPWFKNSLMVFKKDK